MHTRAAPKQKLHDPSFDGRIVADVLAFLAERIELAIERGVRVRAADARSRARLLQDAGADDRGAARAAASCTRSAGRCCWRSHARTSSARSPPAAPRERLAGTLAAVAHGVGAGAHMLRVHDVADVADFLAVRAC